MSELQPELVLAAVERAGRHQVQPKSGASFATVLAHLGLATGSWTTRRLRPQFNALHTDGTLETFRRNGITRWALTQRGRRCLQRARRAGNVPELPEAPQHETWREARVLAGERIEEFRQDARAALTEALRLLDTDANSDAWYAMRKRLDRACARLASATYCLREWPEPSDDRADIDEPQRQRSRRNINLWREGA